MVLEEGPRNNGVFESSPGGEVLVVQQLPTGEDKFNGFFNRQCIVVVTNFDVDI